MSEAVWRVQITAAEYTQVTNDLVRGGFDCCILAAPSLPQGELLAAVLPLLTPSACFAVFSNWMQPLAEAMTQLQVSQTVIREKP